MSAALPVIRVFSDDPVRRDLLIRGLSNQGQFVCQGIDRAEQIPGVATQQPLAHCVIFDLTQPSPVLQAFCIYFAQLASIPAVVFVEFDDAAFMRAAIDAGVAAYVYAGLAPDRLHQVIEMAHHRYEITSHLKAKVAKARDAAADRDVIIRAKQRLIDDVGLTEREAYAWLRKTAMNQNCRIHEVAGSILAAGQSITDQPDDSRSAVAS